MLKYLKRHGKVSKLYQVNVLDSEVLQCACTGSAVFIGDKQLGFVISPAFVVIQLGIKQVDGHAKAFIAVTSNFLPPLLFLQHSRRLAVASARNCARILHRSQFIPIRYTAHGLWPVSDWHRPNPTVNSLNNCKLRALANNFVCNRNF